MDTFDYKVTEEKLHLKVTVVVGKQIIEGWVTKDSLPTLDVLDQKARDLVKQAEIPSQPAVILPEVVAILDKVRNISKVAPEVAVPVEEG